VALTFALTIPLASIWGVEGAAIGYASSGAVLFVAFHLYARHLRRKILKAHGRTDLSPDI
jgi:O-antigen/teichoic acid export membrane protein